MTLRNKLVKMVVGAAAAVSLLVMIGCANLSKTGTYGQMGTPGQWIYTFDTIVDQSYNVIDAAETWELQNYTYLRTNSPTATAFLENVRTNAPKYFADYSKASIYFKTAVGTVNAPAASNQVVAAFSVVTNTTTAVAGSLANCTNCVLPTVTAKVK